MSSLETNKIFAAVLVAGITAMLAGFVAELATEPHHLEKDAVPVEGSVEEGGGAMAQAMPEPILAMIASADIAHGEKLSKACAACHSFDKGGPAKVGPNLWGTVSNKVASHEGFAYSEAMASHGGNWTYLELNKFLWSPKKHIPGTKMGFAGFKKPEDRAAMIAWLRTIADSPAAAPSDAEIAAEQAELAPLAAPAPGMGDAPSDSDAAKVPDPSKTENPASANSPADDGNQPAPAEETPH